MVVLPLYGSPYIKNVATAHTDIQKVVGGEITLCEKFHVRPMFTRESKRWKVVDELLSTKAVAYANDNGMYEKSPNMATNPMIFGQIAVVATRAHFTRIGVDPACLTLLEPPPVDDELDEDEIDSLAADADWDHEEGRFYAKKI